MPACPPRNDSRSRSAASTTTSGPAPPARMSRSRDTVRSSRATRHVRVARLSRSRRRSPASVNPPPPAPALNASTNAASTAAGNRPASASSPPSPFNRTRRTRRVHRVVHPSVRVPIPAATPPAAVPAVPGDLELPAECAPQRIGLVAADGAEGAVSDRGPAPRRQSGTAPHAGTLEATWPRIDRGSTVAQKRLSGDSLA